MSPSEIRAMKKALAVAFPNFNKWKQTIDGSRWEFWSHGLTVKGTQGTNHLVVKVGSYDTHVCPATPDGLLELALEIEAKLRTPENAPLTPFGEMFLVDPLLRLAALQETA